MTELKIGPPRPAGPSAPGVDESTAGQGTSPPEEATLESTTAALVEGLREGSMDAHHVMAEMVEQAMGNPLSAALSEALRHSVREKLFQLLQDDPTLASLRAAMKR